MLTVDISTQAPLPPALNQQQLVAWARLALLGDTPQLEREVAIAVVDEQAIRELNKSYRKIDKPTNVLAFPAESLALDGSEHLGDIVMCAPVIEREAAEQAKPLEAHWAHITIHGMLHLQGYDHMSNAEAEAMEALEISLLEKINFSNPYELQPLR